MDTENNPNVVNLDVELVTGTTVTVQVDKRNAEELANTTAPYVRVWSVDDQTWTHINRAHIVRVTEPRQN